MRPISEFTHFAVIVDGEVASFIAFPPDDELNIAVYNSEPIFVQVPFDERPSFGYKWDGTSFTPSEDAQ